MASRGDARASLDDEAVEHRVEDDACMAQDALRSFESARVYGATRRRAARAWRMRDAAVRADARFIPAEPERAHSESRMVLVDGTKAPGTVPTAPLNARHQFGLSVYRSYGYDTLHVIRIVLMKVEALLIVKAVRLYSQFRRFPQLSHATRHFFSQHGDRSRVAHRSTAGRCGGREISRKLHILSNPLNDLKVIPKTIKEPDPKTVHCRWLGAGRVEMIR